MKAIICLLLSISYLYVDKIILVSINETENHFYPSWNEFQNSKLKNFD